MSNINIKDVAKLAGVSISSVSKAYNDYADISEETKLKIFQAANELGYFPNKFASNLSKKVRNTVAIIINPSEDHIYIDEITMKHTVSIVERATECKLEPYLILQDSIKDMNSLEFESFLKSKGVTSIILFGISKTDYILKELINNHSFNKVLVDAQIYNKSTSSISIDDLNAQYSILESVYQKRGLKNYLYISGSDDAFVSMERLFGAKKFQNEHKDVNVAYKSGNFDRAEVISIINNTNLDDYDCIVCASDMMAIDVRNSLPKDKKDILVCGFDNITLLSYVYPDMPTISQDFLSKGKLAIDALIDLSKGNTGKIYFLPYELKNI